MKREEIGSKLRKSTEISRSNLWGTTCHTAEALILALAYVLEFVKHQKTLGYVCVIIAIGLISPVMEIILYRKDPENKWIKHLIGVGFIVYYAAICLTTDNKLVFVYVLPIVAMLSIFNDLAYCIRFCVAALVVNIVQVIYFLTVGIYTKQDSGTIEIQLLVVIVVSAFAAIASRAVAYNNRLQMKEIKKKEDEAVEVLNETLAVSEDMGRNIVKTADSVQILNDAVVSTKDAMEEVNKGSNDTAEAVQKQCDMTANIQEKVSELQRQMSAIKGSIEEANQSVADGSEHINHLVEQVNNTVAMGNDVKEKMELLRENMGSMESVVEIINNVTDQTSLLALNASIEAARAGESGRGFAVVATEISKLASETDQATDQIKRMMAEFSETIRKVVEGTETIIELIESQNETTAGTAKSFETIEKSTESIMNNSKILEANVSELSEANNMIVDSISTISAISEEVAAHASNTYAISEQNITAMEEIVSYIDNLKELAEQLQR